MIILVPDSLNTTPAMLQMLHGPKSTIPSNTVVPPRWTVCPILDSIQHTWAVASQPGTAELD